MRIKHGFVIIGALALCTASRPAAAACITPASAVDLRKSKDIFDIGGSNFGVTLGVSAGMWSAADLREVLAAIPWVQVDIPSDYVAAYSDVDAQLRFFGEELTVLDMQAKAKRESGSFSKKFTIEVAGIDLYAGSNTLSTAMTNIGPYSQEFYRVDAWYGVAHAKADISGEIGMRARGNAAYSSTGLLVEGRSYGALVLEGTAGVSVGAAGAGLHASVDLLEVGLNFNNKVGLTSGSTYSLSNTYDARTLDGKVALKGEVLGVEKTLWSNSWNGTTLALRSLFSASGCVR